jgi:hypothetical protein
MNRLRTMSARVLRSSAVALLGLAAVCATATAASADVNIRAADPTLTIDITGTQASQLHAGLPVAEQTYYEYFDGCGAEACPPTPYLAKRITTSAIALECRTDRNLCRFTGLFDPKLALSSSFGGSAAAQLRTAVRAISGTDSWVLEPGSGTRIECTTDACSVFAGRFDYYESALSTGIQVSGTPTRMTFAAAGQEGTRLARLRALSTPSLSVSCQPAGSSQSCALTVNSSRLKIQALAPLSLRIRFTGAEADTIARTLAGRSYASIDGSTKLSCTAAADTICRLTYTLPS